MTDHDHDDHDQGLAHDLATLAAQTRRRQVLGLLAVAGLVPVVGCTGESDSTSGSGGSGTGGSGTGGSTSSGGTCSEIPEETAGPYPGDGTNGANALGVDGIVRSDITSSVGGASGVAEGIPLTVTLTIVDASGCVAREGYAVYLWHCDRDGNYSMYAASIADENYLRGVQETDADGNVTFTTIFPACYSGRWPHIHFEVYPSLAAATNGANKIATSQLALPEDVCNEVYATSGYSASVTNLAMTSLATDMVFSDGASLETPTVSGDVTNGFAASLTVAVSG
ncbi:MAG TPA: intradiol ring-cleavage dioxygenase [Polyangiaceae bacterium]|jgi:protocatechuate 3,4-dioxygenase beta subunit|nr:intradiol ring-cleavage dioxygenase [Polyangiaceae bacterium]